MGPRRFAALLAALVAAGLLAPVAAPAGASGTGVGAATAERREELQDELLEATAQEARLAQELDATEVHRDELADELAGVEAQAARAQEALEAAVQVASDAAAEARAADAELRRTSDRLAAAIELLRSQAVSAFMSGGSAAQLNELLEVEDIHQLEQARTYTQAVVDHQHSIVDDVARLRVEVAGLAATAERARAAAVDAAADAEVQRDALRAERDRVAHLRDEADAAAEHQVELLEVVQAQRTSVEAELAALEAVSSSITAWLASSQAGQVASAATRGTFAVPVPTARLSSTFGPRVHPIFGDTRVHKGVDLAAASGTPIIAAGPGTVVAAGVQGGYGNVVIVDHGNALATLYAHQSRLAVTVGQPVVAGQVLGAVGSTGNSTGPHLHFEVRLYGTPVDPLAYL